MPTARVTKAVDVLEYGGFGLAAGLPPAAPDQVSLDGFEECVDRCMVVEVALAAHGYLKAVLAQDFLVVVRTVLAAAIAVEDATLGL